MAKKKIPSIVKEVQRFTPPKLTTAFKSKSRLVNSRCLRAAHTSGRSNIGMGIIRRKYRFI